MLSVSLGRSYIVQHRKCERHKPSSKPPSCTCGCDLFPGAIPSTAGLVKLVSYGHDAGFSIVAKILIAGIVLGFKAEKK